MKSTLQLPLNTSPEQVARLRALQEAFAGVCNVLAPVVQDSRCWNRVALHHMTYRSLREQFPQMGSQMVCNAIYSVSRTCRAVYQSPASPFNLARLGGARLPLIRFAPTAPVYFDRHTLSIKAGHLSMFTLDGRMRFELNVLPEQERRFHDDKLAEIILLSTGDAFRLVFSFVDAATGDDPAGEAGAPASSELPEYVLVLPEPELPLQHPLPAPTRAAPLLSGDPA